MKKFVKHARRPRVALLVESSRGYGRGVLWGVAKFVRQNDSWSIFFQDLNLCDDTPGWLKNWRGDGIISRLENRDVVQVIEQLKVPAVYLRHANPKLGKPGILADNTAISRLCGEHLKERGFRHFAFCGFNGADYSDERRDSFVDFVRRAGFPCHVYTDSAPLPKGDTAQYEGLGLKDGGEVANWIKKLPKPIGLMACNDMRGQQVLDACRATGVASPEEIAVIGVDNDDVLCNLSDPPLSSVVPNAERIGYEAAALLARMMAGAKIPAGEIFVAPSGIVTRRSTDVLAMEDRQIAAAARFIREHACDGIDVADVLRAAPMSRSTLDRRFLKLLGRSPKDEILRIRLDRVKQLLAETDFSLSIIAEKVGLAHVEHLSRIFKSRLKVTPSEYRAQALTNVTKNVNSFP
ncbi:MAG TPA: DNA-binding transcriptional regulator [Verrucomicrobiae bacterium]|jgi:LacI family transcriptional regulator|nr:DNA-binding transcriptional regulator [Verrucomicrobiae bacterium]